jgi:hypothetical protein
MTTQLRVRALEGLIDELARVLWEPEQAKTLVLRAGFPPSDLPAFEIATAFWSRVIREAADGKIPGGVQPIVDEVASRFPGNMFLAAYRAKGACVSRRSDSVAPSRPNAIATRPKAAYVQRERLMPVGKSTEHVDARVLELRREQRRGPTAPSSMGHGMPSWSVILPGVVLAGLVVSGVTLASAWWKSNVDGPWSDIALVETSPLRAGASMDMADPVEAIEYVENAGMANALVAADDPVEIRSEEEFTKSEGKDDAVPDNVRVDADVGSPSKGCILGSSECNPSPKNSGRSSGSSRSKAIQTGSEELDIHLSEVGGAPIDLAMATDCPLDPTKCNPPEEAGDTSGAHTSRGSTKPGAPEKRLYANVSTAFAALKDTARACGPQHGAEPDEKVYFALELDGTSGTVLSATREPHADTPLGSCVEAVFEDIEVIEFMRVNQIHEYVIGM